MKIAVFGGTGSVGQLIVNKLTAQGENVVILSRQAKESSNHIEYIAGDVLDENVVEQCIEPGDRVVVALGFNNSAYDTMSRGTANIIAAMKSKGASQIICLSSHGVAESWMYLPENFREYVKHNEILTHAFADHGVQEELVKNSGLDWTIVRPTEIVDVPEKGTFTVNTRGENPKYHISKHDVAQFIADEIMSPRHLKEVCTITD